MGNLSYSEDALKSQKLYCKFVLEMAEEMGLDINTPSMQYLISLSKHLQKIKNNSKNKGE